MESALINDFIEVKKENLVYWIDETEAERVPEDIWNFGPADDLVRGQTTWLGESRATLTSELGAVSVTYQFPHKLWGLDNRYKIGFWVSPNIQAEAVYELYINGESTGEKITVNPMEDLGVFKYFNMFEIDDEEQYEIRRRNDGNMADGDG